MFEFLQQLYYEAVYRPQLNLLQLLFNLTGDIGVSIILLALIVNLCLLPFFAAAYINTQKARVLQPLLADIREKYKSDPATMLQKTAEFNRAHGIRNSSLFWVIVLQLVFATAVWRLTQNISSASTMDGGMVELPGLYYMLFKTDTTSFDKAAFGFLNIGNPVKDYVWLPILTALISVFYGYYTFNLAPKPKIFPLKKPDVKSDDTQPVMDPEAMQRALAFQTTFFFPIITFILNYNLTTGVNIYFFTLGLIALVRQIGFSLYYTRRTDVLLDKIIASDPSIVDDTIYNNLEITAPGDVASDVEVPELVLKSEVSHVPVKPKKQKASTKKHNSGNKTTPTKHK